MAIASIASAVALALFFFAFGSVFVVTVVSVAALYLLYHVDTARSWHNGAPSAAVTDGNNDGEQAETDACISLLQRQTQHPWAPITGSPGPTRALTGPVRANTTTTDHDVYTLTDLTRDLSCCLFNMHNSQATSPLIFLQYSD